MSEIPVFCTPSPSEIRQIEQICDRFEVAWKAGQRPRLEAYLSQSAEPLHAILLRHLLPLDWEYRLRADEQPQAAEYAARLPAWSGLIENIGREIAGATVADRPPPQRLGEYRIVRRVGRGGMGVVYEAVHEPLGRRVALKLLPGIDLTNPIARERFRREAQMTARLKHPNIVQIFEVGEHEGQPFLVLEYVAGPSLGDQLRDPQPPRQAAALVETLAWAIHHAHEQGIIHRDLKPANVLLDCDGPDHDVRRYKEVNGQAALDSYRPKITDFGLAHAVGDGELTATGEIVGTPGYMAPEQAWGKTKRELVDRAADVYALGAVLYAALTGRPPFIGATALDALEQVRSHEPVPPTRFRPQVPRDLETVCLKCLEKEPSNRYASAEALAEDLRRFRAGEPVAARRTGQVERLRRWCWRNPAPVAASVLGVVALVAAAGLVVSQAFTLKLRQEQKLTKLALQDAEIQRARAEQNANKLAQQQELTTAALVEAERFRQQAERISTNMALERGLALLEQGEVARAMLLLGHSLQIAPAGAADLERVIRSNLAAARQQLPFHLLSILEHGGEVQAVVFSPDGKTLLTGGRASAPRRWDAVSGEPIGDPLPHDGDIRALAFSADGSAIATAGTDKTARLWDARTGKTIGKPLTHAHWVQSVAFSPDGKTILTGSADGTARLWEAATGEPRGTLMPPGWVHAVAFSPDGKTFATTGSAQSAQLWDAATLKPIGAPLRHYGEVWGVAFSPDGRVLLTGCEDGTARLWEADTGKSLGFPLLHQGPVRCVGFGRDGKVLWTAGAYGKVRLWDATTLSPIGVPVQHQSAVYALALSPDQSHVATGSSDGKVRIWEKAVPKSAGVVLAHERLVYCVAFSPDGKMVATGSADPSVRLWDATTGRQVGKPLIHPSSILRVAFSPDGRTLLAACSDKTARMWDVADCRPRGPVLEHADHVYAVAFSPDGNTILTGCKDSTARLWDATTGELRIEPLQHPRWVHAVAFSPDGKTILTGCEDATARLWDAATGKSLGEPLQHRGPVRAVAFSPDGRMLLTGTWDDGTARLWDATTRKPLGPPMLHQEHVLAVAFSPDGETIATGSWDGTSRLWDVATGKPLGPQQIHQRTVRDVAFSPDGKTLLTGSFDRTARFWELPVAIEGKADQIVLWIQALTGMELDQDGLFRDLDAATWRQRRQPLTDLGGPPSQFFFSVKPYSLGEEQP